MRRQRTKLTFGLGTPRPFPTYLIIEFVGKHPVVNLRLLANRNLALSCALNFVMGAALYDA
jgi:hypothetical protein